MKTVFRQLFILFTVFIYLYFSGFSRATLTAANYTNPIIYEDYSDPDVIRVGEDYWMTASSFNCWPGLPILHSYDLVHWEVVNHALKDAIPGGVGSVIEHGNQVWAPAIRFHNGVYYITWGDPDVGIYQVHTTDPRGQWSAPHLIVAAKGYIDACPFWDTDGRTYIVHAMARSRAGIKSVIQLMEVNEDLTEVVRPSILIFDGHETQPTCEGPKMYKRDGYYYIFFPAGGVPTGWQTVIRATEPYGSWDEKIVMAQGATNVNGPHQGGWVTTPTGEDWFIHFQDVGPVGRIIHLQPMQWLANGWPVIGVDTDGDGCGDPVINYSTPTISKKQKKLIKANKKIEIGTYHHLLADTLQWQWHRKPAYTAPYSLIAQGQLPAEKAAPGNLWQQNMVLKKITGPDAVYTTQIKFDAQEDGDRCGFIVMGHSYAGMDIISEGNTLVLRAITCYGASKGKKEMVKPITTIEGPVFISVTIHSEEPISDADNTDKIVTAEFSYSLDGVHFTSVPFASIKVEPGKWIGAKVGYFCISEHDYSKSVCKIM